MRIIPSSCLLLILALVLMFGDSRADEKYRVVKGDNLYRIGRKFGIDYREIMSANRLSKTVIYPNQVLLIPRSREIVAAPVVPAARVWSPTRVPESPPAGEYAGASPRFAIPVNTYESAVVPRDPVKPFVAAQKLPPAPPLANVEDPLGLGYDPNARQNSRAIKAQPVEPRVVAHKIPTRQNAQSSPRYVEQSPPRGWSREVPAVAAYPGSTLDPRQFPMPSFQNPCKPSISKSRTSSSRKVSGGRTYTVCSGDSVLSISRKFGVPALKLRHANGIMFSRIKPGMCLTIP